MIIGLSGYAGSGKDTAADLMDDYTRVAFADALKATALAMNPWLLLDGTPWSLKTLVRDDWDAAKRLPPVREYLQALGMAVRDHIGRDAWVSAALDHLDPHGHYVVSDVRFPNEADAIKARGGVIVRITRPGVTAVNGHVSEHALTDYPHDHTVTNDSTPEALARQVLWAI